MLKHSSSTAQAMLKQRKTSMLKQCRRGERGSTNHLTVFGGAGGPVSRGCCGAAEPAAEPAAGVDAASPVPTPAARLLQGTINRLIDAGLPPDAAARAAFSAAFQQAYRVAPAPEVYHQLRACLDELEAGDLETLHAAPENAPEAVPGPLAGTPEGDRV